MDKTGNESNSDTWNVCVGCGTQDYCIWSNKWNCWLCEECKFNLG